MESAPLAAFPWRLYAVPAVREVDYLRDVLATRAPDALARAALAPRPGNGGPPGALLEVVEDIQQRLTATGGLDAAENYIKRRRHNNENYYELDEEFIDDEAQGVNLQQLVGRFEDFFCFRGSREEFQRSEVMGARAGELERAQGRKRGAARKVPARRAETALPRVPRAVAKRRGAAGPSPALIQLRRSSDGVFTVVGAPPPSQRRKLRVPARRGRKPRPAEPAATGQL